MNTALNLSHDIIDRDAERVAHDTDIVRRRATRPNLLARAARRTWREVLRQWELQGYLHRRELRF